MKMKPASERNRNQFAAFAFSNKKMKIEITFVWGDRLLNIKASYCDIFLYYKGNCFVHEKENWDFGIFFQFLLLDFILK